MKHSPYLIIISFCLATQLVRAADKPFDTIITKDANMILSVSDISELRESWKAHPLVSDFGDASLDEFFESLLGQVADPSSESDSEGLLEEFGLEEEELFELFPGQIGLALYNLPDLLLQKNERPDLAIIADFAGSEDRLDELMQIQFERNAKAQKEENPEMEHEWVEERFMGVTLHFDEAFDGEETYVEDGYALVDGVFILATPEERLRSLVESVKLGAEDMIGRSAAYRRVMEDSGPVDMMFYLNFESFIPALNEALVDLVMKGGLAMFGVTGKSLNTALSLEALQAFSLTGKINKDNMTSHSSLIYREKAGLLKLFTYGEGALPAASYVPESILSSTVALYNLSGMFAELEAMLGAASPSTPALINIQLQQIKKNTGVDLRATVLDNFGPGIVSYSLLPDGRLVGETLVEPEQVYVIDIKDAAAMSGALEALKDLIPGARAQIQTREFEGETINTIVHSLASGMPEASAYDFSFAVTRTHLLFSWGKPGLMQGVISAMQSAGAGFWQMDEIQGVIDQFGDPGAVSRSYTDLNQVISSVVESIRGASELAGDRVDFDTSKIPEDLELPWHLLTETHEASDGIFSRMILLPKEETR